MYQRLQCRDTYFFKIKFVFFLYLLLSASWKENELPLCIYFLYQTVVYRFLGVSILQLLIVYHIYDLRTMICWRCHSNSLNTGSRLPYLSDVKTRKRRNVVGIDMIRNNRITIVRSPYMTEQLWYKNRISRRIRNHSEAFDPDDPTPMDRYPTYDWPPTPTKQRYVRFKRRARRKRTGHLYVWKYSVRNTFRR